MPCMFKLNVSILQTLACREKDILKKRIKMSPYVKYLNSQIHAQLDIE